MSQINWINQNELDYLVSSGYINEYPGLINAMNTPKFTISDMGVTHRDATYWDKKEILPILKTKGTTRRKYTLKQAVWIKLIQQLRSFDVSLNQIKKYKESILSESLTFGELLKNEQVALVVEELARKAGHHAEYLQLLTDPNFKKSIEKESIDIFEILILYVIVFKKDMSYISFQDGQCLPYSIEKHQYLIDEIKDFGQHIKLPHIVLSITQAICQLIKDWNEKDWFEEISIISKEEKKILKLLREDKTTELKIIKSNNQPDRVIQVRMNKANAISDFANQIIGNGYQKITVNTRKGKVVSYKNEVSIKLKESPE